MASLTNNSHVLSWIEECKTELLPERIVWIDGSKSQQEQLCAELVNEKFFTPLNSITFPNSYWCCSDASDVARVEERTYICSKLKEDAGPTNNWASPDEMYKKLSDLMKGCMKGRTMYIIPYLMGPDGSPYSKVGFEVTDSKYVVVNMAIMARVGNVALKNLGSTSNDFVRGMHSVGQLDPQNRFICHFPDDNTIISFNSNYGGNALQGKKCFALRIASTLARREGWLAEHMFIVGITNPKGEKYYVCGAFPSACGKTNLAMLVPPPEFQKAGWKVETVGDDIAWLNFGPDGKLYAINPEAGFFGVAPGTSAATNPNAMATIRKNTIFTNTALDLTCMAPWWEGMSDPPERAFDWKGREWNPKNKEKAAHPNSRFTVPASQCPSIDKEWESAGGVPISAIIFGGRRAKTAPLVYEARDWKHGTYMGVTMASETTAAAAGKTGQLRRDPMAMLPFIGYHAGDYFQHWIEMGSRANVSMPKIFHVNWFRTSATGKFLWPGFGENIRVLEWIIGRINGSVGGVNSLIGMLPEMKDLDLTGLTISEEEIKELLSVKPQEWREEIASQEKFFRTIGKKLPKEIWDEHAKLTDALR